jgi:hypothetical protein
MGAPAVAAADRVVCGAGRHVLASYSPQRLMHNNAFD